MREKYVDERYSPVMIFGERSDGTVNVSDATRDIAEGVTRAQAEAFIAAYNKLQNVVVRLAQAFDEAAPEAFSEFWYGSELARSDE